MPAFDQCHDQVVRAFQKAGWHIEDAPYRLFNEPRSAYIDMRVSRGANGSREGILLIEVKCFPDRNSTTRDLYTAIGQYLVYRAMIYQIGLPYALYLTILEDIFEDIFDSAIMKVVNDSQIKIAVINLETEEIVKWIE